MLSHTDFRGSAVHSGRIPRCVCVAADGLRDHGDRLHLDTASQEFGRRYTCAMLALG